MTGSNQREDIRPRPTIRHVRQLNSYLDILYRFTVHEIWTLKDYCIGSVLFDGLYYKYKRNQKERPTYTFLIKFPSGFKVNQLWLTLLEVAYHYDMTTYENICKTREDSTTKYTFGPDVRSFIDNHGSTIRNCRSYTTVVRALEDRGCTKLYPKYVDKTVRHVRPQDTSILGPVIGPLAAVDLNWQGDMLFVSSGSCHLRPLMTPRQLQKQRSSGVRASLNSLSSSFVGCSGFADCFLPLYRF